MLCPDYELCSCGKKIMFNQTRCEGCLRKAEEESVEFRRKFAAEIDALVLRVFGPPKGTK